MARRLPANLTSTSLLLLLVVVFAVTTNVLAVDSDARKLANSFKERRNNELGVKTLQNVLDSYKSFKSENVDGMNDLRKMEVILADYFNRAFKAIDRLFSALGDHYAKRTFDLPESSKFNACCDVPANSVSYSYLYKQKVDMTTMCYRLAKDVPQEMNDEYRPIPISENLLDIFKDNSEKLDLLKWQYFGTVEGQTIMYPANKVQDCYKYDNRLRPWYRHAVNPDPVDIVIAIDYSDTMKSNMAAALKVVRSAIDVLMPRDRMALILFRKNLERSPSGCTIRQLTFATQKNKGIFLKFLEDSSASVGGNPDFLTAIDKAFDFIEGGIDNLSAKAILFISDSGRVTATSDSILMKISARNGEIANKVTVFTYLVGEVTHIEKKTLLTQMAEQTKSDSSKGRIRKGLFTNIVGVHDLSSKFVTFYSKLATIATTNTKIITHPYSDFFYLGDVITIAKSFYINGRLIGTAGVDIKVSDIATDVIYYQGGTNGYAFIFNKKMQTAVHPLVPPNREMYRDFSDIEAIEDQLFQKNKISALLENSPNSFTVNITLPVSRGNSHKDGVNSIASQVKFNHMPINGTELLLVIVNPVKGRRIIFDESEPSKYTDDFLYHRLDLQPNLDFLCRINTKPATKYRSTVKFSGIAFKNSVAYFNTEEMQSNVGDYTQYMAGQQVSNENLKPGIREMVVATEEMDSFWNKAHFNDSLQRFVGTKNGVFRIFPGQVMQKTYDHTRRRWYEAAEARPNTDVFTTPYVDVLQGGAVLTLSRTVHEKKATHSSSDKIVGVMGMDFKISRIQGFLEDAYPRCASGSFTCFIIDDSGYFIYHHLFLDSGNNIEYVHITELEPDISLTLIEEGYMLKTTCIDLNSTTKFHNYKISSKLDSGKRLDRFEVGPLKFLLEHIPDTNIYVGVSALHQIVHKCNSCERVDGKIANCELISDRKCNCPCTENVDFDKDCDNKLGIVNDARCTVLPPVLKPNNVSDTRWLSLDICNVPNCKQFHIKSDCQKLIDCEWCPSTQLHVARCALPSTCSIQTNTTTPSTSLPTSAIIGMGVGFALAGIVATLVFAFLFTKYRKNELSKASNNQEQSRPRYIKSPVIGNPISQTPDIVPEATFTDRKLPQTPDESIYSEVGTVNTVYSSEYGGAGPYRNSAAASAAGSGAASNYGDYDPNGGWNGQRNMAFDPTYGGSVTSRGSSLYGSGAGVARPSGGVRPSSDQPTTSGRYHPTAMANGQSLPTYSNQLPNYQQHLGNQRPVDTSPIYEQQQSSRPGSHFDRFETDTFDAKNNEKSRHQPSNNISMLSYPPQQRGAEHNSPQANIGGLYAPKLVKKPSSLGSYI